MFTPQTFPLALLMMITSAICWGSWANTYKGVKNYRFELFYWDYAIGIFLMALILGHTMGSHLPRRRQSPQQYSRGRALPMSSMRWSEAPSLISPTCCWSPPSTWPDSPLPSPFPSASPSWSEPC